MNNLPARLRERVARLNAALPMDLLKPGEAVWLACDLLVAGVDTPALRELAGESPARLTTTDAVPLVRQMLAELGVEPISTARAAWVVARDVARQMIDGGLPPEVGARSLWGLWWSCDTAAEIGLIVEPLDAWEMALPAQRDTDAIRAEMLMIAHGVVGAADARLAAIGS